MSAEISKVITVEKAIPVEFDLGLLSVFDINPIPSSKEDDLLNVARDSTQLLLNSILSCPIQSSNDGVLITLPEPITRLPREKPVPVESAETKWAKFARLKGIQAKKRDGKMVFDEEKEDWVPKWGYKGQNKDAETAWAVELDDKKEDDQKDPRIALRAERKSKGISNSAQKLKNKGLSSAALRPNKPVRPSAIAKSGGKVIKRSRRH